MLDHGLLLRLHIYARQVSDAGISSPGFFLDDVLYHPALVARERAGFHDLDLVADLATDLIMGFHTLAGVNDLAIQRVAVHTSDLHHNRLGHFVAGYDTSHATTIVHASPFAFSAEGCSRRMVSMRAISRRRMRKRLVSVSWPVTAWKRSFINSSRLSASLVSISPGFRSRSLLGFTGFIPALLRHDVQRSWS